MILSTHESLVICLHMRLKLEFIFVLQPKYNSAQQNFTLILTFINPKFTICIPLHIAIIMQLTHSSVPQKYKYNYCTYLAIQILVLIRLSHQYLPHPIHLTLLLSLLVYKPQRTVVETTEYLYHTTYAHSVSMPPSAKSITHSESFETSLHHCTACLHTQMAPLNFSSI